MAAPLRGSAVNGEQIASPMGNGFMEAKGQFHDQYGQPRPDVDFLYQFNGSNLVLSRGRFSYDTHRELTPVNEHGSANDHEPVPSPVLFHRLDVELVGADRRVRPLPDLPLSGLLNFYNLPSGHPVTGVRSFGRVVYPEVYPGIDLVFRVSELRASGVEYDFVLKPGADLSKIRLRYTGAKMVELGPDRLLFDLRSGPFAEELPQSFDALSGQPIEVHYVLHGDGTIGFNATGMDASHGLVIDPTPIVLWSTYVSVSYNLVRSPVDVDAAGNALIAGQANNLNYLATAGTHQDTLAGMHDIYVAKFDPNGTRIWGTFYGGPLQDIEHGLVSDTGGNAVIIGKTRSETGLSTTGSFQEFCVPCSQNQEWSGFIAKFDPNGLLAWGTYLGGFSTTYIYDVACGPNGDIVAVGGTYTTSGIATIGAYQTASNGNWEGFVVKFNSAGARQWGTYFGGSSEDRVRAVTIMSGGDVAIGGSTYSNADVSSPGAYQLLHGGSEDGFVARFDSQGALAWSTYYGGSGADEVYGIVVDASDDLYVCGPTSSAGTFASAGGYDQTYALPYCGFVARFTPGGIRDWGTYVGEAPTTLERIACDGLGNVLTAGWTSNGVQTMSVDALQPDYGGGSKDLVLWQFDDLGALRWSTFLGGAGLEDCPDIAIGPSGNTYVKATTESVSDVATPGSFLYSSPLGAGGDFLMRIQGCMSVGLSVLSGDCSGPNAGSITAQAANGTPPYAYSWNTNPVQTTPSISNLSSGVYEVTVTDSTGCTIEQAAYVPSPITTPGTDLSVAATATSFGPTFQTTVFIEGFNAACAPTTGELSLVLDPLTDLVSSVPPPSTTVGDTLIWSFTAMTAATPHLVPEVILSTSTQAMIDDTICLRFSMNPVIGDLDPSNNIVWLCSPVLAAYDPNDKQVGPGTSVSGGPVEPGVELTYAIRFQNTGTAPAVNVFVIDTVDAELDLSSFTVLGSSHPMEIDVLPPGNVVKFRFDNINLPDSNNNEPESHGYILFRIDQLGTPPIGTMIENTAFIYFDYNEPVVTNTTASVVAEPLFTPEDPHIGIPFVALTPNPASAFLRVQLDPRQRPDQLRVTDMNGRLHMTLPYREPAVLDVSKLAPGPYLLTSDKDHRALLIIER